MLATFADEEVTCRQPAHVAFRREFRTGNAVAAFSQMERRWIVAMPRYLSHALITQAVHDIHSGRLWRCKEIGFDEATLDALKDPLFAGILTNARVAWYSIKIDHTLIQRLLTHARNIAQESVAIDRALRLDASEKMLRQFYGVTKPDITLRRNLLGIPRRTGRRSVLTEHQEIQLWERWHSELKLRDMELHDEKGLFELCLDLAEQFGPSALVIWAAMRAWIEAEQSRKHRLVNSFKE